LTNTLIQDGCPAGATCSGVLLTSDPFFVRDPDPGDGDWTTPDDNDYGDLRLQLTSPAINKGDNSYLSVATDLAGNPRIANGIVDLGAYETNYVLYVDHTAGGANNGSSWEHAFTNLQNALAAATGDYEIWVATGVYTPGTARTDSFALVAGVKTYGGFDPASGIEDFGERDWEAYPTVLSGDIDGDDGTDANGVVTSTGGISGANNYHVIFADGTSTPITGSTLLDGFIITAGQADGSSGGGFFCDGSGGGAECSPSLRDVTFSGNSAHAGGAMSNNGLNGGESSPSLREVAFSGNSANFGGAMQNTGFGNGASNPSLINVAFSGNSAYHGGAMYNDGGNGGDSNPSLINVTFSGNSADNGGAMYSNGTNGASSPSLGNAILWGNTASSGSQLYNDSATPVITASLVEGGLTAPGVVNVYGGSVIDGGGNIDDDPLFVRNPDPGDGNWATPDDNDYGDLRLRFGSPAINQGDNSFVAGVDTDLAGNERIQAGTVDLGAYETSNSLYVDDSAGGANNGASWDDAFTDLQSALAVAINGNEIWVATGVYTPGTARTDSFGLVDGVETYGGFDPASGIDEFGERDWEAYPRLGGLSHRAFPSY